MSQSIKSPESISQKRRALLELLLKEKRAVEQASNKIQRRPPFPDAPLSFAQQQIWFFDQLDPGGSYYNCPVALRLKGRLDVAALGLSFNEILRRHEILRTTYDEKEGTPVQIIHKAAAQPMPILDFSSLEAGEREAAVRQIRLEEGRRPFDLKNGPVIRTKLLRLSADEHMLLLTLHHICSDGWSMLTLYREMAALYEAFSAGRPSPLAELPIQYADYAVWQRRYLQGEKLEKSLSFWRRRLKDAAVGLDLPTDKPRPVAQTHNGAFHPFVLPHSLTQDLQTFSQREGVTLPIAMLAAFKALLYRYTRQDDILVGMTAANRVRPEIENLLGFFINTFVLRTRVEGDESFRRLVARVRETALAAYDHQELPVEKLMEELRPERDLSHNPLFQVMFNFMFSKPAMSLSGLVIDTEDVDNKTAKFDLELTLWDTGDQLSGAFEYSSDLFEAGTIARLYANFQRLLEAAVASPDDPVAALPIVSAAERRQFDAGFGAGPLPGPETFCWFEIFERRAARDPSAIALTCGDLNFSYGALDRRSSQAASLLSRRGVEPETVVALLSERTPELVIWMLAAHRAGGAYLPLDPNWPVSRLAQALRSGAPAILVSSTGLEATSREALAEAGCATRLLVMGDEGEGAAGDEAGEIRPQAALRNLAYIIYTSGSTGEPKGAVLTHTGLLNHLRAKVEDLSLSPSDVVAQTASQCFDISVWQMWAPLLVGASIRLVPDEIAHDPSQLLIELDRSGVTVAELVPSVLGASLDHLEGTGVESHSLTALRWLLVTGETLPPELCRRWLRRYPSAPMMNAYGPTECSDDVTHEIISAAPAEQVRRMPIGGALRGIRLHVVDSRGALAPIGVIGELWCGGAGIGRGYVGRPDLTAERFAPDPFSVEAGARLYQTGDLARWLPDGRLEFLGRMDHQVKVRGFRIELAEIEAVLRRHEAVGAAAVVAREGPGTTRLVAYIVGRGSDAAPEAAELREWLGRELPSYMTPSAFVALDSLPLTENGKLDRKALPEPETIAEREPTAPRTSVEEIVADIWADVLHLERVGVEENFFELGGHSLLATQVISRIREVFKVEAPLRSLFQDPTVRGLCRSIEGQRRGGRGAEAPPLVAVSRDRNLPLSYAQQRMWFLAQLEPDNPFYNIAMAVRLEGELDLEALGRAINEVRRRHESLRMRVEECGGEPAQVIEEWKPANIPVIDVRGIDREERECVARRIAEDEMREPFTLSLGSLFRVKVLRMAELENVLYITMHHIVSDGWSTGVLIREIGTLYEVYSRGERSPLEELEIQYADYAVWQREWLQGEVLERQLEYWKRQLEEPLPVLELVTDRPRPKAQSYRGSSEEFCLGVEESRKLRALSRRRECTMFMTLLSAFKALLMRYSGQADLVVGTSIANRARKEVEGLIGFFVNQLALRTKVGPGESFVEVMRRVRETALDAYTHQDVPFEKLVEELQPERDLGRSPIYQIMFMLQNAPIGEFKIGGLRASDLRVKSKSAKLDLILSIVEEGEMVRGVLEYNTDLFDAATIKRMIGRFQVLLEAIPTESETPVGDLPLMSACEMEEVVNTWNETSMEFVVCGGIPDVIYRQVMQSPEAVAVVDKEGQLSYRELDERASQVGNYLRAKGVRRGDRVAVVMGRSTKAVVALLGVMKAGGSYVPIDPHYPAERIGFMLKDSRCAVVLSEKELGDIDGNVVMIEEKWEEIGEQRREMRCEVGERDMAYVIYTSGSTGQPKGVMAEHGSVVNMVEAIRAGVGIAGGEVWSQSHTYSFDFSVWELWGGLLSGGRVVIMGGSGSQDPERDVAEMVATGVTVVSQTPSGMRQQKLVVSGKWERGRRLIVGGESLSVEQGKELCGRWDEVWNFYGPTEATVWATIGEVTAERESGSIGRPIGNMRIYILDQRGEVAPVGGKGDIYIAGGGVTRGYLNRPDLTAERFLPTPFGREPGGRMYKAGDLGRWRPDGNIEFLGRNDFQVKIRGFRIELGEIEARLTTHPAVQEAVVLARDDGDGGNLLVAYYTGEALGVEALRAHLSPALPKYMVPSVYIRLDAWPLTPNGKLDRQALPEPRRTGASLGTAGPRTYTEEVVAGIWADVLNAGEFGLQDNFFDLGGHSLLATRVVSRVRGVFGIELPLRVIFESPVLAEFASSIELEIQAGSELDTIPLAPISRDQPIPLSLSQQKMLTHEQMNPGTAFNNVPILMRLRGELDLAALEWGLGEIIRRHEILRTTFETSGGVACQVIHPPATIQIFVVNLTGKSIHERETYARRLAYEEGQRPFDLAVGPLLRAGVMRLSADEHLLLLVMHHLLIDPWSLSLLMRELTTLCGVFGQGEREAVAPLPDLPVQFADYAVWQRKWLQGEVLKRLQDYWRERLGGRLPSLNLPRKSKERRPSKMAHGATCLVELPASLSGRIKTLSSNESATPFISTLAAFKATLYLITGNTDIIVTSPMANRQRLEVEPLIGFFANSVALRTRFDEGASFRELLRNVRETAIGAYMRQALPLDKVVEALGGETDLSWDPIGFVNFSLLTMPVSQQEMGKLGSQIIDIEVGGAPLGLALTLLETTEGFRGKFTYRTDTFDEEFVLRMAEQFRRLLQSVVSDPDQKLSDLKGYVVNPAPIA